MRTIHPKRVALSGATGFIGSRLTPFLERHNYTAIPLERKLFEEQQIEALRESLRECHAVINLAGAPITKRWSEKYREVLIRSRTETAHQLVRAIHQMEVPPALFISASATGYYPTKGCFDEYNAQRGSDFLAYLCQRWEGAALGIKPPTRIAIIRMGTVLSPEGGAYGFLSGKKTGGITLQVGNPNNLFPWVSMDDLLAAILFLLEGNNLSGTFNIVAPHRITLRDMSKAIHKRQKNWLRMTLPHWVEQLILGDGESALLQNHCVKPQRLLDLGFSFTTPTFASFLERCCKRYGEVRE